MRTGTLALLLCGLLFALPAAAQEQRGAIEGTVKDMSGAVLPGVTVEARSPRLIGVGSAVTDAAGAYRFPALPPGIYEVTASLQGFNAAKVADVEVLLGQLKRVDLVLAISGVTETVQVTGESPLIDVKQSASFNNIRSEQIENLPRGRDFTSLVAINAGTSNEAKAAGISIDGASGAENRYVIDGIDTTSIQTGVSAKGMVTDVLEEVQVKSSGYNAEYGGSTGGVINVITKSGSDRWQGDVGTYVSSSGLDGPVRPTLRLNLRDSSIAERVTLLKDHYARPEPAFTLGGPIVRDRLWFFTSYIPQLQSTDRDVTFFQSGQTVGFHQDDRTHNSANNVTMQIGRASTAKLAVNFTPRTLDGILPSKDGTDDQTLATKYFPSLAQRRSNVSYSGNVSYVASNRLFFSVRGGFLRTNVHDKTSVSQARHTFSFSNLTIAGIPDQFKRPGGFSDVPAAAHSVTDRDIQTRLSVNADATYYASFAGTHTFKAGAQIDRAGNNVRAGETTPLVTLRWGRSQTTSDGRVVTGTYGTYQVRRRLTTGDVHSNAIALFVQDAWSVNKRLTLNLGLRSEYETVPTYETSHGEADPAIIFRFAEKMAPRMGFAWDVTENSKWKAYGSWGMFYDQTKVELGRLSFGGVKSPTYRWTLDTFDWPSINCTGPANSGCPGTFIEAFDGFLPSNLPDHNLIDPTLEPFSSWEFTLGLDHELSHTTSAGVRYVHKGVIKAIEDLGVNVPGVGTDFYIGNPGFGVAKYTLGPNFPQQPRAKRNYDGVEARIYRRLTNGLGVNASYLWSRLWGNYPGLASSDENGRASPNQLAIFDSLVSSFDGSAQPLYGPLGTDRPHQVKAQAIARLPWGSSLGALYYIASGRPVSRQIGVVSGSTFYKGRLSDGRTPVFSQTDFYVQHEFKAGAGRRVQVSVNVLNLFDQMTVTDRFIRQTVSSIPVTDDQFFHQHPNLDQLILPSNVDPRFLKDSDWQAPRAIRLGVKYVF